MSISAEAAHHRSRIGRATQSNNADAEACARRDLRATLLAEYAQRAAAEAPPLTQEQIDRICALLRGAA